MSLSVVIVASIIVFAFTTVLTMAGLGAAFILIPALYWLEILCVPNSDVDLESWLTLSPCWCSLRVGPHLAPTLDA